MNVSRSGEISAHVKRALEGNRVARAAYAFLLQALTGISPEFSTRLRGRVSKGKGFDLLNPRTFNERVSWLKVRMYNDLGLVAQCADKARVREYVTHVGCGEILNECFGVFDGVHDIPWEALPDRYALKWTSGAGGNYFCRWAGDVDRMAAINHLLASRRPKASLYSAEMQYRRSTNRILCEAIIETVDGRPPVDFKIYCYSGEPRYILVFEGRSTDEHKLSFYDTKWNRIAGVREEGFEAQRDYVAPRPAGLASMLRYAARLSEPFPFVRVDLYDEAQGIVFGELTFTPCGGIDSALTKYGDWLLGEPLSWLFEAKGEHETLRLKE